MLGVKGSHASSASSGDGLAVPLVLNVPRCKHAVNTRPRAARHRFDVTLCVHLNLAMKELGVGHMPWFVLMFVGDVLKWIETKGEL